MTDPLELRPPVTDEADLAFDYPAAAANPAATHPKCIRHAWSRTALPTGEVPCIRCSTIRDEARAKRGLNNRGRGLSIQRQVAAAADMVHIPGNGPADARDSHFYAEIKSGPSWYSTRVEAELDNLPTDTGRTPVFIAASTPGPGNRRRVYVTTSLGDLVKLVGGHVQVSMWLPEWVSLKQDHGVTREDAA